MNSTNSIGGMTNVFGGGFGDAAPTDDAGEGDDLASGGSEDEYDYEDSKNADGEIGALADTLTKTSIKSDVNSGGTPAHGWGSGPWYPAIYLNTVYEHITPAKPDGGNKARRETKGGGEWELEGYERSDEDEVFQRFASRVAEEGTQCIRQVD